MVELVTALRETARSLESAPLKVKLRIDGWVQPRWVAGVVEVLREGAGARLAGVEIVERVAPPRRLRRHLAAALRDPSRALLHLYTMLDELVFDAPDALAAVDLRELGLVGEELLAGTGDRVDAIFDLTGTSHDPLSFTLETRPVWSLSMGGVPVSELDRWAVREVLTPERLTVLDLSRSPSESGAAGEVLARCAVRTDLRSPRRGRALALAGAAGLVRRAIAEATRVDEDGGSPAKPEPLAPPATAFGNSKTALDLARHGVRFMRDRVDSLMQKPRWTIAIIPSRQLRSKLSGRAPIQLLEPPRGRFWADPFLVEHGGRTHLLFEDCPIGQAQGHIAAMEVRDGVPTGEPRAVLVTPHHLSYPFQFEHRGQRFMMPEGSARRAIEIYRAREFPDGWEHVETPLRDIEAVDATLARIGDRYWLFCGVAIPGTSERSAELHVFYASSPFGPFRPHRKNPVVSDVRHARPAGALIDAPSGLFRPAQDCSARYGGAISIRRITRLTSCEYEEVEFTRVQPTWAPGIVACHTLNRAGALTVIDAQVRQPLWSLP